MVKKNRFLLSLVVLILCVSIAMLAFACNKDDTTTDDDDDTQEETLLFTNGDFTQFTKNDDGTVTYPATPSSWTGTPGSTSSSSTIKTPQSDTDIAVGVISVGSDYDKTLYDNADNPGKPTSATDNKVLMIHNKVATSYSYVSSSTTIAKDTYYKLSFFVKTVGLTPKEAGLKYGAYVYVKGGAYIAFEEINTNGDWIEYTAYFRGSNSQDKTITLTLGLGEGDLQNGHMVQGYAYFDHVVLTDLTNVAEGETAYTEAQFNAVEYTSVQSKADLRSIDGNFNYATISTSPFFTPSQLTGSAGSGSGTAPSTGSAYLEKGILDTKLANDSKVFSGYSDTAISLIPAQSTDIGNKQVTIHNKQKTAYTYKDSNGVLIAANKYYKLTLYARTYLTAGKAHITLNSSSTELETFDSISTGGEWKQYTIYVEGNQYAENTAYISMSLGIGGEGDGKWAQGVAFFDDFAYSEVTVVGSTEIKNHGDFEAIPTDEYTKKYSYYDAEDDGNLLDLSNFVSTQYEESFASITATPVVYDSASEDNTSPFTKQDGTTKVDLLKLSNAKYSASSAGLVYKNAADDTAVDTNKLTILPNTAYAISFWVKTVDLNDGGSASIVLNKYDEEKQSSYKDCKSALSTMSSINDSTLESYKNADRDDYSLVTFYVLGDVAETKYVSLDITLGTGTNAAQSASLVKGTLYLTNLRMQTITYEKYSAASTGTTTFKYSFTGSGASGEVSSNGMFDYVDMDATITLYGKDHIDDVWNASGELISNAVPTNWSITNSSALTQNSGTSTAGVIDVNTLNSTMKTTYSIDPATIYDSMDAGLNATDNSKLLLIDAVAATGVNYLGYKSNSISLSAKSYYLFSVYAKSIDNSALAFAVVQSGNDDYSSCTLVANTPGTDWKHYLIYVQTGISSTSVTVQLFAASPLNDTPTSAQALFTMATYATIDEDIYNAATEGANIKKLAWFTDTMYLTSSSQSETELATPSNWTGAAIDSNASTATADLAKGIFDQSNGYWDVIGIDPDATDTFADKIFTGAAQGDSVLVIDNKVAGSYGYTSTSFTLEKKKYYKVSIDILTKDIAFLTKADIDEDDSKYDSFSEKNIYNTATVTLSVNNKTYTFGKNVEKDKTAADFTGDTATADWNEYQLNKARILNNTEWTTLTYYIALDKDIDETVSATLKISLGGKSVSYWAKGYVFADNFTVEELSEADYTSATTNYDAKLDPANEGYDATLAAKTYKIAYTNEDATAAEEEEESEEEENNENKETKDWLWLYITSGVIGGLLVIILVIYLIKRYAPKKKFKKAKKTLTKDNSSRGQFGE